MIPTRPRQLPRRLGRSRLFPVLLGIAACGCPSASPPTPGAAGPHAGLVAATAAPAVPIDYHVHLLGDDLLRDWRALGVQFSRPDDAYRSPAGLLEAAEGAEAPAVERVLLVPMAHLYGNSEMREGLALTPEQEQERTARENTFVAQQAAAYPGRARALCSVSVLRPYALQELERCRTLPGVGGIKLHLANSEVDLRVPADVAVVAQVAAWSERHQLPILLHLDTQRRGTEVDDIKRFLDAVVAPHPELVVLVAHLGGSGGYGPWTQSVFRTLVGWVEAREAAGHSPPNLSYDISAVLLREASEGVAATTAAEGKALAEDLRRVAFRHVVFGSDYPVFAPRDGRTTLAELAGLGAEEIELIMANRVPEFFE